MKISERTKKRLMMRWLSFIMIAVMLFTPEGMGGFVFAENNDDREEIRIEENDISLQGTASIGELLAAGIDEKTAEAEKNGCAVYAAQVSGNQAELDIDTIHNGFLIAAVYDDAGEKMLTSASTMINTGDKKATVQFSGNIPEYFYLRAYIVDDELAPLSQVYNCPLYTRRMQEFLAKTTDDFAEEDVLNLDEDKGNNFLVYKEGIVRAKEADGLYLKAEDGSALTYVFEDGNEILSILGPGDILAYEMNDGCVRIVSVKSISRSGNTVNISGDKTDKEEVFSYIKIDAIASPGEDDMDFSGLEEGVEPVADDNEENKEEAEADFCTEEAEGKAEGSGSFGETFKLKLSSDLDGTLELGYQFSLKYYYDVFHKEDTYVEFSASYELKLSFSLSVSKSVSIYLGYMYVPLLPGVFLEMNPELVVEAEAGLSLEASLKQSAGFRVMGTDSVENISTNPEVDCSLSGEIGIYVGLSLEPSLALLHENVANIGLKAKAGVEIKGGKDFGPIDEDSPESIHECNNCIDGDINLKLDLAFSVKIAGGVLEKDVQILGYKVKIADWYFSVDHFDFGFGECPYKMYKTEIYVSDKGHHPIWGALISGNEMTVLTMGIKQRVDDVETDYRGKAEIYQKSGWHGIDVYKEGYEPVYKFYSVEGKSKDLEIILEKVKTPKKDDTDKDDDPDSGHGGGDDDPSTDPHSGDPEKKIKNPEWLDGDMTRYSVVYFGNYWQNDTNGDGTASENDAKEPIKWRVLQISGDDLFLLAECSLDTRRYNETKCDVTWENCTLRSWLNGYGASSNVCGIDYSDNCFIKNAFNADEINAIKDSYIVNADCERYGTPGGNNTVDKVFLLSETEVFNNAYCFLTDNRYGHMERIAYFTRYGFEQTGLGWDFEKDDTRSHWWLRTPGFNSQLARVTWQDGYVGSDGDNVDWYWQGVRPAIHIPYSSKLYRYGGELYMFDRNREKSGGLPTNEDSANEEAGDSLVSASISADNVTTAEGRSTAYFSGLDAQKIYNLYVMKEQYVQDPLADENLLYIGQERSGEDGNLSFTYIPKEVSDNAAVFVVGMKDSTVQDDGQKEEKTDDDDKTDITDESKPEEQKTDVSKDEDNKNEENKEEEKVVEEESPLGPDKADLSQYTASGNEIAVKSLNLKKTVFAGIKGIKRFVISGGDMDAAKINGSTLKVLKNGTVTLDALNKKNEKLAEKTLVLIAPSLDTSAAKVIMRRGNVDLNKYIQSTVQPSSWKSSNKKIAEVNSEGLMTIKKSGSVKLTAAFPAKKGMKVKKLTISLKIKMPGFKKSSYSVKAGKSKKTKTVNTTGAAVTYRIEEASIATVDENGTITGIAKGTTRLIMTVNKIDYSTIVKVK